MTTPWLAPDGRPWGEPERGRGLSMALIGDLCLVQYRPNHTRMAWAVRYLCDGIRCVRARRLFNGEVWRFGWAPWEF